MPTPPRLPSTDDPLDLPVGADPIAGGGFDDLPIASGDFDDLSGEGGDLDEPSGGIADFDEPSAGIADFDEPYFDPLLESYQFDDEFGSGLDMDLDALDVQAEESPRLEETSLGLEAAPPREGDGKPPPPSFPPVLGDGEEVPLGLYVERAYLEYAVSVVKGRALPDVADGQKPVQRRILYAMNGLGLGANAKPVKSARVVGNVIGRFHPHGDQAAYDAMVRLAQDFTVRYPLVDGQGNFGSRDGDSAAAMRYTEARLTRHADLLLSEIDLGTVDFIPNYDGSGEEPALLPARLPMVLMNGASGIAVGMATEIPPHNLREVARAAVALIENRELSVYDLMRHLPGPDFPGGGQVISPRNEIFDAYMTGRGTLKVRARHKFEELAAGRWQVVITEMPPGCSTQRVLEEIEELTNPKIKTGKKSLSQEQVQDRQLVLSMLDGVRDESGRDEAVRLVLEPRKTVADRDGFVNTLLAYTSLETTVSINMVTIGRDGRPRQLSLRQILSEWIAFRFATVRRRTRHRLDKVLDRIHVLEGRHVVLLHLDDVIRLIQESEEPRSALMETFHLSERQADDILEIRLRQLARLEGFKIEQELSELRTEQAELENLLSSERALRRRIVEEIEADAASYGDERRTLIEERDVAAVTQHVVRESVTVILSQKGWIRARNGHGLNRATLPFKKGDGLRGIAECQSVDPVILLGSDGRTYSVAASQVPLGRGEGIPVTALVDLPVGTHVAHVVAGRVTRRVLVATSGGFGFPCKIGDMTAGKRAGKAFLAVEGGETVLPPVMYYETPDAKVAALSRQGRLLVFALGEMKRHGSGGRGLPIVSLEPGDELVDVAVVRGGVLVEGVGPGGEPASLTLTGEELAAYSGARGETGRQLDSSVHAHRLSPPPLSIVEAPP